MRYCTRCLTTDLRPNAQFVDSVCIACRFAEKQVGDRAAETALNLEKLRALLRRDGRTKRRKSPYDCIVGVSGGKDSTRQALWVKNRLGAHPLLVCVAYPPLQMSSEGAANLSNLIELGFDVVVTNPAPRTAAALSRHTFEQFGNLAKASELALFSTVPRVAIEHGIKTIFWGENPALQVGDAAALGADEFDGNNLREMNTLREGGIEWLKQRTQPAYKADHYEYPSVEAFAAHDINIYYLGAAWDDWSNHANAAFAALHGLELRHNAENETGDISNASMLDEHFTHINHMLKYYKFGFGKTTDVLNEMIRDGRMSRTEAITVAAEFDGRCDDAIVSDYCKYIGITESYFWEVVKRWTNRDIFKVDAGLSRPVPRFTVGVDYSV